MRGGPAASGILTETEMTENRSGGARVLLWMTLFVLLGAPFVFLIWEFLNELFAGRVAARRAGLALLGAIGLAVVLALVARRVRRWEGEHGA